jgi:hypothetical protein
MNEKLLKQITEQIGMGIHASLRKYTNSEEAIIAYNAISSIPDDEWTSVCRIVAGVVIEDENDN